MQRVMSPILAPSPQLAAGPQRNLLARPQPTPRPSEASQLRAAAFVPGRRTALLAAAGQAKAPVGGGKGATGGKGFGSANAPSVSKSGVSQTCACGSKAVYRECCEPYHLGAALPTDVESALRARFCGFVKGRVPYLVSTFHPDYHSFKYEGSAPGGATDKLRRDVEAATKRFTYSNLKVLEMGPGSQPDEAFITFRYNSVKKVKPETNIDGSIMISTTVERSRFLRAPVPGDSSAGSSGTWLFADFELLDYPSWMEETKQAERKARGQTEDTVASAEGGALAAAGV